METVSKAVLPFMELRSQLETECTSREEIEAELCELKQNSVPAATLSEKLTPDAATIFSQLRTSAKNPRCRLLTLKQF